MTEAFGTQEVCKNMKAFLLAQSSIIYGLLKNINLDSRATKLKVVLGSCCQTATAIAKLSDEPQYFLSECTILGRAFIEKIINFCYLLVCDNDEFERFMKYTVQKSYRKLDRSVIVGTSKMQMKFSGSIDINRNRLLQESLKEFTGPKGREITRWTKVKLEDRIRIITEKSKLKGGVFMLNLLNIYEDASEALHGTLYGCAFHIGAFEPNIDKNNPQEVRANIYKRTTLLLWTFGILFHVTVLLLSEKNDIKEAVDKSNQNDEKAHKLMKRVLGVK
jgi:DNA-binding transcriptional regulator/RsmH inhibitor MraZ